MASGGGFDLDETLSKLQVTDNEDNDKIKLHSENMRLQNELDILQVLIYIISVFVKCLMIKFQIISHLTC